MNKFINLFFICIMFFVVFFSLCCSDNNNDDKQNEENKEFTVTFVANGEETIVEVKDGEKAIKPIDPVKEGYTFLGWYLGSEEYDFEKAVNSNFELIAKFEEIVYTVKFIVDEEETITVIKEGEKAIKPIDPVKDGYTFLGWFIGEEAYDFEETITSDLELVAKFEEIVYTVKFIVDEEETITVIKEGEKVSKPANPEKVGYEFIGWYVGEETYDFEETITSDLELVAKFELIIPKAILTEEIEMYIKQACCNYWDNDYFKLEDYRIKDYLGQYGDAYCAIIIGDSSPLSIVSYTITLEGKEFVFNLVPEFISIYYNNTYYPLGEACELGIINIDDLEYIYAYFYKYCNNYIWIW